MNEITQITSPIAQCLSEQMMSIANGYIVKICGCQITLCASLANASLIQNTKPLNCH